MTLKPHISNEVALESFNTFAFAFAFAEMLLLAILLFRTTGHYY